MLQCVHSQKTYLDNKLLRFSLVYISHGLNRYISTKFLPSAALSRKQSSMASMSSTTMPHMILPRSMYLNEWMCFRINAYTSLSRLAIMSNSHSMFRISSNFSLMSFLHSFSLKQSVATQWKFIICKVFLTFSHIESLFHGIKKWTGTLKHHILDGIYWTKQGFHLFGANLKVSTLLLKKKIQGQPLSYREHKLLIRTTHDLLKLIPFSFFIIIPFAELLLPVALWIFPGMLPSTFSNRLTDNKQLERKLQAKRQLAQFFQELIAEHTRQILDANPNERLKHKALLLREFQDKLISKAQNEATCPVTSEPSHPQSQKPLPFKTSSSFLSVKDTLKYAKLFREEFQLEKMPTQALLVLCEMLGLHPYRIRANIILQLRYHILRLQEEDRHLLWEGVDILTEDELRDACRERAMKFYDISIDKMREQMLEWLELSSHRDVSPLLLLWSRSITMIHGSSKHSLNTIESEFITDQYSITHDNLLPLLDNSQTSLMYLKNQQEKDAKATSEGTPKKPLHEKFLELNHHLSMLKDMAKKLEEEQLLYTEQKECSEQLKTSINKNARENSNVSTLDIEYESTTLPVIRSTGKLENGDITHDKIFQRYKLLKKELNLFRTVANLQHERTELLLQSLASIIDIYRSKKRQIRPALSQRMLETFVKYLEKIVQSFSSGVEQISNLLEAAKDDSRFNWLYLVSVQHLDDTNIDTDEINQGNLVNNGISVSEDAVDEVLKLSEKGG